MANLRASDELDRRLMCSKYCGLSVKHSVVSFYLVNESKDFANMVSVISITVSVLCHVNCTHSGGLFNTLQIYVVFQSLRLKKRTSRF